MGSAATPAANNGEPVDEDDEFLDPITKEVIVDPVVGSDGITYDRCAACPRLASSEASR